MIRISKSVQNNAEIHIEDNSDHVRGLGDQASHHAPPTFYEMQPIPL